MRKALIAVIVASALFAVGAFAAQMGVDSDNVASGQDAVTACGTADVEWNTGTTVTTSGATADWLLTNATVTLTGTDCDGAIVDLAIGLRSDGNGALAAQSWIDADCPTPASGLVYTCTPASPVQVRQVVDAAVLANGNSVPALTP